MSMLASSRRQHKRFSRLVLKCIETKKGFSPSTDSALFWKCTYRMQLLYWSIFHISIVVSPISTKKGAMRILDSKCSRIFYPGSEITLFWIWGLKYRTLPCAYIAKATHETRVVDFGFFQFSIFGLFTEFIRLHLHCNHEWLVLVLQLSFHLNYCCSFSFRAQKIITVVVWGPWRPGAPVHWTGCAIAPPLINAYCMQLHAWDQYTHQ